MEQIASWVAPVATTIAALMTASNLGSRITGWGFVVFTVGSLAWLTLGITTDQANLLWQNVVLTCLNLFGIWRWLGRQAKIEDGGMAAHEVSVEATGETLFPASLLGKAKVLGNGGRELGTAVDAMLGCSSGRPLYVVVAEGGIAGVGEKLRRIDWSETRVQEDSLMTDVDELSAFEVLEKAQWPGR